MGTFDLNDLITLSAESISEFVHPQQLSVSLLLNGTRRWYIAEYLDAPPRDDSYFHDYMEKVLVKLADLITMLLEHGVYRIFLPVYSWHQPNRHPKAHYYLLKGIEALLHYPQLAAVYRKFNCQVRFYGSADHLSENLQAQLRQSVSYSSGEAHHHIYYGLEGEKPHDYSLQLAYEFGLEHNRPPTWEDMLEMYYGDRTLRPLDILIGFNRIYSRMGIPHLLEGNERIYNTVVTPLVLSERSFKAILHDYFANYHDWGRDYKNIHPNEIKRLKRFYALNQDSVIGLVRKYENLVYPVSHINWPDEMDEPT